MEVKLETYYTLTKTYIKLFDIKELESRLNYIIENDGLFESKTDLSIAISNFYWDVDTNILISPSDNRIDVEEIINQDIINLEEVLLYFKHLIKIGDYYVCHHENEYGKYCSKCGKLL